MTKGNTTSRAGLKVIGAGLPRTATSSLQTALQILGYKPCYHTITDFVANARSQGPLWIQAMQTSDKAVRQKLLLQIVQGYEAIVDGPGCFFVADWVEMFPEAKFVLGLRNSPEAWLTSVNGSIGKVFGKGAMYWIAYFVPELHYGFLMNNLWDEQTTERYGVEVRSTRYYELHNEEVRRIVPKDRLLEFKAADGWGPLCEFLEKERPVGEFPHRNDAKAANGLIRSFAVWGVGVWVLVGVSGWGLVWSLRRLV